MTRIALDAMGGDFAPAALVEGAIRAVQDAPDRRITLVGREEVVRRELERQGGTGLPIEIVPADEVVGMDDSPVNSVRLKPNSSIARTVDLLREGRVEAMVSAGNTGAVVAATKITLRALPGVERSAIAIAFPNPVTGMSVVLDAGANSSCKPVHLMQFGVMGHVFAKYILGFAEPRVGLMSVGEEASKGNDLTREGYRLLERCPLNFIGNVEGRDVFDGTVDVVVCDGFVGNVILKLSESLGIAVIRFLKDETAKSLFTRLSAFLLKPAFRRLRRRLDYAEYGGAPLIGVDGVCIICHGRSRGKAIMNAIRQADEFVKHRINEHIVEMMATLPPVPNNNVNDKGALVEARSS